MDITIDAFCKQWKDGKSTLVSQFEKNVFDFTTIAGHYSKRYFTTSFLVGGFYGSGKSWEPRSSKWGKKFTHPVLRDTGTLHSSINEEARKTNRTGWRDNGKRLFVRGARYDIWTTETSKVENRKRGKNTNSTGYAAIHNTDPGLSDYTINQYSKKKPVWRQFIGFNPKLENEIHTHFLDILFKEFPH